MDVPPIYLELLEDGRHVRLIAPYTIYVDGTLITVPAGFITDGATSPRVFWRVAPPFGRYAPAAVVHDWLYYSGSVDRQMADSIFYTIMERCKVPAWQRKAMFWFVRKFGIWAWNKHRKREREENAKKTA